MESIQIEFNYLNIIVGTLIPLAVGLLTKASASSKLKAWVNAGLTALSSAIMVAINMCAGDVCDVTWGPFFTTFFMTYVPNIASYYGFWKPSGTAGTVQAGTANLGLGGR